MNKDKDPIEIEAGKLSIYVRGKPVLWEKEEISYREVVDLAYPDGQHGPQFEYDVSWKKGPRGEETGTLNENQSTKVINGMRFDVKFTDRS